ncbi:glycosyltransferase family 1 protein [Microbacterium yannicii]|uniref:rhamnosyltransferase WsaF family glycosyltransferase n=1 Tax=Microbacterium yannicii TaxID=671622 RepID=UPI0002F05872|nr:glycosyltransferase family 1 protein [Microbacterium yannicii]
MMRSTRSAWRRLTNKPPRHLLQTMAYKLWERSGARGLEFPLDDADVWDSLKPLTPPTLRERLGRSARIGWIVVPPVVGSGGHTTLFRMVAAASRAGLSSTLLYYDRYHGDFTTNVDRLRQGWPWLDCEVADAKTAVLEDFDVLVASAWSTAHFLASATSGIPVRRLYLIQDYEPDFYPKGSLHALAEDSYRFGLTNISLGPMISARLLDEVDADSREIVYGTDRTAYSADRPASARRGIAFFARTGPDRRGYRLGVLALREFQRRRPDVPIHAYGDHVREPELRVTNHGSLTPAGLNRLYNEVNAGLVLSFTNVSLVPAELAAAGAVPVLNDFAGARAVFDNPYAAWARATPAALAAALVSAVEGADDERIAGLSGWPTASWDDTADELVRIILEPISSDQAREGSLPGGGRQARTGHRAVVARRASTERVTGDAGQWDEIGRRSHGPS